MLPQQLMYSYSARVLVATLLQSARRSLDGTSPWLTRALQVVPASFEGAFHLKPCFLRLNVIRKLARKNLAQWASMPKQSHLIGQRCSPGSRGLLTGSLKGYAV